MLNSNAMCLLNLGEKNQHEINQNINNSSEIDIDQEPGSLPKFL